MAHSWQSIAGTNALQELDSRTQAPDTVPYPKLAPQFFSPLEFGRFSTEKQPEQGFFIRKNLKFKIYALKMYQYDTKRLVYRKIQRILWVKVSPYHHDRQRNLY